MKILITTDWYRPVINGVVTSVLNLTEQLEKRGHEVKVLTLSRNCHSYKEENVIYAGSVGMGKIYPQARVKIPVVAREYMEELLAWKPDLIHSQCEFSTFFLAKRIAGELDIPIIHTFDMPVGSIVKEVTTGTYGVLSQGKKDWDDYLKRIEDRKWYVDFSDIQVMVYELTESGCWSHNHMNPLYLQLEEPEHIPGDEENQTFISAMKAFGNYLQSEDEEKVMKGQAVIQTAREYAEIKRCKEWQTRNLNEAMKPEDIMF